MRFLLKQEHVKLMKKLNFKTDIITESMDHFRPVIDGKRPFGNSSVTVDICEILGFRVNDETGEYTDRDIERAESILIELPVALSIVVKNQTFTPGLYGIDEHSPVYYNYIYARNYHALKEPLMEMEKKYGNCKKIESLHRLCMNISGNDPWTVINDLKWYTSPFGKDAVEIFKKHASK